MNNKFDSILKILPVEIREELKSHNKKIQEIRIRVNKPICIISDNKTVRLKTKIINKEDIIVILQNATKHSLHSYMDNLKCGFITIEGGHRIGVCGSFVMNEGKVHILNNFSSLNIRIAHEIYGCADNIMQNIDINKNLLIISPPCFGKTTLLREIIRNISKGDTRVCVADERGEICGVYEGVPQFDLGENTDVLDNCPKDIASMMLIRTMSPNVLILDEITSENDIKAAEYATNCGVSVFATAHAFDEREFFERELYKNLILKNIFENAVIISKEKSVRQYKFIKLGRA